MLWKDSQNKSRKISSIEDKSWLLGAGGGRSFMEVAEYSSEKFVKEVSQAPARTSLATWVPSPISDSPRVQRTTTDGVGGRSHVNNLCPQKTGGQHPMGWSRRSRGQYQDKGMPETVQGSQTDPCPACCLPTHISQSRSIQRKCWKIVLSVCFCPIQSLDL